MPDQTLYDQLPSLIQLILDCDEEGMSVSEIADHLRARIAELDAAQRPPLGDGNPPTHDDLQRYLTARGWVSGPHGPVGVMWSKDGARVGVPHRLNEHNVMGVVERIARAEQRATWDVLAELRAGL